MGRRGAQLSGTVLEENSLAWLALQSLVILAGSTPTEVAADARISRASLSPPPSYVRRDQDAARPAESAASDRASRSGPTTGRLSMATARAVQRVLHSVDHDDRRGQLSSVSLVGLVARLSMSTVNLEVHAPARWLDELHRLDTQRERDGLVRADGSDAHGVVADALSREERAFRGEAVISRLMTLRSRRDIEAVLRQLGGRDEFRRRYVDPLLRSALAPPGKGVEAITMLARMGDPALEAVAEQIHEPWGYRLYRVLAYSVHWAGGGVELEVPEKSEVTELDLDGVELALKVVLKADELIADQALEDIYPGRALQVDLVKELVQLRPAKQIGWLVGRQSSELIDLLERRMNNPRRPDRERCYAAWLLHHLSRDDAWAGEVEWERIAAGAAVDSDALTWAIATMGSWNRHSPTWSVNDDLVSKVHRRVTDLVAELNSGDVDDAGRIHEGIEFAFVNHLTQALTTPNGRWRRQVADAGRAAALSREIGWILGRLLADDEIPMWVRERACFVMGFVQDIGHQATLALIEFGTEHVASEDADGVEGAHAAVLSIADVLGLSVAQPAPEELVAEACALFVKAAETPRRDLDTHLDLAGVYGLKLVAHLKGASGLPLEHPTDVHRRIIGDWVQRRPSPYWRTDPSA